MASRANKQLNKEIVAAILNIGRCYNMKFYTHMATPSSMHGYVACSNILHGRSLATQGQPNIYTLDRIVAT